QRRGDGRMALTPAGEIVARHAEAIENQVQAIGEVVGCDQDPCVGTIRVTSVPIIVNRLLAGAAKAFLQTYPGLTIELIADSRDFTLTRREADIALRLARPSAGGTSVKARRLGALAYAAYASRATKPRQAARLPWITYSEAMSHLPQARWVARL